jgi:poly(3-hydroxybutyrate) depolymerase
MPKLRGNIERGAMEHGGRMRIWIAVSPCPCLIMNGTDDPLNPWRGGGVVLYGVWGNRGRCSPRKRVSITSASLQASKAP